MKANELRVRNLVNTEFGIRKIAGIYNDGIIQLECGNESVIEEIEPIPLTEEWLLKFGFEKVDSLQFKNKLFVIDILMGSRVAFRKRINEFESIWLTEMHYVHQLQNLYFALTGEELTLSE